MKRIFLAVAPLLLIISSTLTYAAGSAQIDIRIDGDTLNRYPDNDPTLDIWIANDTVCGGFQLPLELSSPDGVFWTFATQAAGWGTGKYVTHVTGNRIDPPATRFDLTSGILVLESFLPSQIMMGACVLFGPGLPAGELQHMLSVHIAIDGYPVKLSTLCVDINVSIGSNTFAFVDYGGGEMTTTFLDDNNDGIWCFPAWISASTADETSPRIPETFGLGQNYPNPFNPATVINYSMERKGKIDISIFNVLGQHVKTLVNGEVDAGTHQVVWDGTDRNGAPVASGVYFYKMITDKFVDTRKMALMR